TAQRALNNTLQDERGRWILASYEEQAAEFAITAELEGEPQNLIIDRTFVDKTATRWIIDYKATAFDQGDLESFLQNEQEKYLEKMRLYQRAMQLLDSRP